jgi:ABC-2 type transport system ATP-binding protein
MHEAPTDESPTDREVSSACTTSEPVLSVRGLTKRYGDVVAVDALTFKLDRGTITGFLGPNGAGKTTTLRLLLGLARPTVGEALVFGRRYAELERPMDSVGAVLESGDFDPGRSGRNHLRVLALAAGIAGDRVDEVLGLVELVVAADRPLRMYSLGMRQRLGLAAALLGDPDLLLLDEPANGLDPAGIHWLRGFLRQFADQGRTVLICSHVLAEVAQTVDAAMIVAGGRLLATVQMREVADGARSLEELYLGLTGAAL